MQKNITSSFSFFFIIIVICLSFKIKADENFSFSNAYKKALSNSNMIKKNEFLLNSKSNLISNAYSNKDWNLDFTSSLTLDNKKSDNIGDYVDQKTTVNTISLDKTLIDFGFTDKSVEIALNNKKIASNNLLLAKQNLFINTLSSYLNVYNSNKILDLRVSNVNRFKTAVKAAKLKLSAGTITPTTVSEAEARLARSEYELATSKTEQINYVNEFKSLIGEDFNLKKMNLPEFKYSLPKTIKEAESLALNSNLNILNITLAKKNAELLKAKQLASSYPSLDLDFYLKNSESDSNSSVNDYSSYGTILTFKSSLLRNKSESSLILSLDNNYKSILEEQNELIRVSKLNTLSLFNKYINSDFNVIAANKEYNASKLALNGVKKEEEFGLRTLLDVLDIEVDLMNSEVRLLKSKSDQLLNKYKLLIDIGKYNF
jgi:outer membrane protein TolC|tara:strand:+ start:737 stop:2026 length:1290 start_codon:yes stop_codon:yes gene_type:complete